MVMDLVDRLRTAAKASAFLATMLPKSNGNAMTDLLNEAADTIEALPAADVWPVKRGSWIEDGYYNEPCVCSECGEPCKDTVMGKPRWNFCPNCGAKMEG